MKKVILSIGFWCCAWSMMGQVYVKGEEVKDSKYISVQMVRAVGKYGFQVIADFGVEKSGMKANKLTDADGEKLQFSGYGGLMNYFDALGYDYVQAFQQQGEMTNMMKMPLVETHLVFRKR